MELDNCGVDGDDVDVQSEPLIGTVQQQDLLLDAGMEWDDTSVTASPTISHENQEQKDATSKSSKMKRRDSLELPKWEMFICLPACLILFCCSITVTCCHVYRCDNV